MPSIALRSETKFFTDIHFREFIGEHFRCHLNAHLNAVGIVGAVDDDLIVGCIAAVHKDGFDL